MSSKHITSRSALLESKGVEIDMSRCYFWLAKHVNVRKCVAAAMALSVISILFYSYYVTAPLTSLMYRERVPRPLVQCSVPGAGGARPRDHRTEARLRIDSKVLVLVDSAYSRLARDIAELLVANRIRYKLEVVGKNLPALTLQDKGRFGVIIFESLSKYANMDHWNQDLLKKYCRDYSVGVVAFVTPGEETLVGAQLPGFPLFLHTNLKLKDATLNPESAVLRVARAGETAWGPLPGDHWAVFRPNSSTYEPIAWAYRDDDPYTEDRERLATVLLDSGRDDGVARVLFGSGLQCWLHRLLLLDALSFLSHGHFSLSLDRHILVDIDDIFVGEIGTRLHEEDVAALVAAQDTIAQLVPGFRFNLGFSAKYYHHGTRHENKGDDMLLANVDKFWWFSHMWNHQQPHLYANATVLEAEMALNKAWAAARRIPVDGGYSVAPHHSGVYPVHQPLYDAWRRIWAVNTTSTEEYPHLRPARLRRGFSHDGVRVLPRQTCGLFTHTLLLDRYPGGRRRLDDSIQGGELFQTIVDNPISIFMTHMSNYGNDRLALYAFESVVKFVRCWTNLRLLSAPPRRLAYIYFKLRPDELNPIWGNPCEDVRHRRIWSPLKSCASFPRVLVVGPQKSGSTALHAFLALHPALRPSLPSPRHYEELQFFTNNEYYRKGLDWYMSFFPVGANETGGAGGGGASVGNATSWQWFEKSATYFDGEAVPRRARALLPFAKIVVILAPPEERAYSWYQHQRAHGDVTALGYTFHQVITANDTSPKPLRDLRNRCLNPGKYAQHLERWVAEFPAAQLVLVDGEELRRRPPHALQRLQHALRLRPTLNYDKLLRFDAKKGFYCVAEGKCLGASKGRSYPRMEQRSARHLARYYAPHHTALAKLLRRLARPLPPWLDQHLI